MQQSKHHCVALYLKEYEKLAVEANNDVKHPKKPIGNWASF
jgi:hypothetical protein